MARLPPTLRTLCLRCMKAPEALVKATQRVAEELENGGVADDGFTAGGGFDGGMEGFVAADSGGFGGGMEGFVTADAWDQEDTNTNGWGHAVDAEQHHEEEETVEAAEADGGDVLAHENSHFDGDVDHQGDAPLGGVDGNEGATGGHSLATNGNGDSDDEGDFGQLQLPQASKDAPPPKLTEIVIDQGRRLTLRCGPLCAALLYVVMMNMASCCCVHCTS